LSASLIGNIYFVHDCTHKANKALNAMMNLYIL